jgi:hypothetical protein
MKQLTQSELIQLVTPIFETKGQVCRKHKTIFAVQAKGGEHIETITSDGQETSNTASAGDYIVTNQTEAGERYVISKAKFEQRYRATGETTSQGKGYQSISEILALELSSDVLQALRLESPFYFTAKWGEKMVAKEHDYLATPLGAQPEVYRIAAKEFAETYSIVSQK